MSEPHDQCRRQGSPRKKNMNEREAYIRQVFETTLYFRDMCEEGGGGHTGAIQLLKPIKSISNTEVRQFVLHELLKKNQLSLMEAAERFAMWAPVGGKPAPYGAHEIKPALSALCLEHERSFGSVTDEKTIAQRSYLRAARYIELIYKEQVPVHSRIVELFIPDEIVPHGTGDGDQEHREHVVPCLYLLEKCKERFSSGARVEDVADFLARHVVVVKISKKQQQRLDASKTNGGLGYKNTMPKGWQPDRNCIFQRLHEAAISFKPPEGFNSCDILGCQLTREPRDI